LHLQPFAPLPHGRSASPQRAGRFVLFYFFEYFLMIRLICSILPASDDRAAWRRREATWLTDKINRLAGTFGIENFAAVARAHLEETGPLPADELAEAELEGADLVG
jgi:hypothetical protein